VGSLLGALGMLALALSLFRFRRVDPLLAAFGAFALLYGVRLFFDSELIPALGIDGLTTAWVVDTITYVIGVPAWLFFRRLLGPGWRSILNFWIAVVGSFAVVGVASDLIQGRPETLAGRPNNALVLAGLAIVVVVLLDRRRPMTGERKFLLLALAPFAALVVNDNLVGMRALPWTWRGESIGFVLFVACLGALTARRFFGQERRLAALESELETARQIQQSLLPERPGHLDSLSVAVRFGPSSAVAGDLYDFLSPSPGTLAVLVADVSGHGVPAALLASMVKVATISHAEHAARPADILVRVNRTLCESLPRGFVTATYAYLDPARGEARVANAGHPPPLLIRAAGGEIAEVGGQGPILGRFRDARFAEQRIPLVPGDRLVLFTDGLPEARNAADEIFGDGRLAACVRQHRGLAAEELCDALLAALGRWIGQRPPLALEDDLTLLVIDVAPGAGGPAAVS